MTKIDLQPKIDGDGGIKVCHSGFLYHDTSMCRMMAHYDRPFYTGFPIVREQPQNSQGFSDASHDQTRRSWFGELRRRLRYMFVTEPEIAPKRKLSDAIGVAIATTSHPSRRFVRMSEDPSPAEPPVAENVERKDEEVARVSVSRTRTSRPNSGSHPPPRTSDGTEPSGLPLPTRPLSSVRTISGRFVQGSRSMLKRVIRDEVIVQFPKSSLFCPN